MARGKSTTVNDIDFTTGRSRPGGGGASDMEFDTSNRPGLDPNNAGGRPSSLDPNNAGGVLARGRQAFADLGTSLRNAMPERFRAKGDAIAANPSAKTTVDAGKSSPEVAKARQTKNATQADAEKVVSNSVPDTPDGRKLKQDAGELAKEPSISRTLQKWGVRGGIGVVFLMMLYDTANPFEAIAQGAEDAKDTVKGAADVMSSIFEAIKGLLGFLTQNWMVSAASSCCCVFLMILPMIMGAGRSMAPRPRFGGPYY